MVNKTKLAALPHNLRRLKLAAQLALLERGLSVPEACSGRWQVIGLERRTLMRVGGRQVILGVQALEAL